MLHNDYATDILKLAQCQSMSVHHNATDIKLSLMFITLTNFLKVLVR